jgi:hypothetical protein
MKKQELIESLARHIRPEGGQDQTEKSLTAMYNLGITHAIELASKLTL